MNHHDESGNDNQNHKMTIIITISVTVGIVVIAILIIGAIFIQTKDVKIEKILTLFQPPENYIYNVIFKGYDKNDVT